MPRRRAQRSVLFLGIASVAILACDRRDSPATRDSSADTALTSPTTSGSAEEWVTELGPLFVVPADSENTGVVLFPAEPSPRLVSSTPLTLLSPAGDSTATRASLVVSDSQVCGEAPIVRLSGPTREGWSVGLRGNSVRALPMDSIESLPSADSVRLAADLARLASTLPMPPESRFSGLP